MRTGPSKCRRRITTGVSAYSMIDRLRSSAGRAEGPVRIIAGAATTREGGMEGRMGRRLTTAGCRKDPGGERREGRTEECRGVYITPHSGGRVCVCARREGEYLRIIERRRVGNRNEDLLLLRLLLPLLVGTQSLNVVRINAGILSRWLL